MKKLLPFLAALLVLVLLAAGVLHRLDRWTQDALYQQRGTPSGDIVIIGIDGQTLADLGPYGPSYRAYMAYALAELAADPENRPAVVAVDILYEGLSGTPADDQLAQSAAALGNVVTASMAEYGDLVTWENGRAVSLNAAAVVNYVEPYDALKAVTSQAHINAMSDRDGVLRHALLYVRRPDGEQVLSMAALTSKLYLENKGQAFSLPSVNAAGHYYVPFTGKPGDFDDGYSLSALLTGRIPSAAWAGKIVLIGPYAAALQDAYFTAADRAAPMYGVEYQANVIQSLLQGNLKAEVDDLPQLIVVGALLLAAAFLFFRLRIHKGGYLCAGLVVLGFAGSYVCWLCGFVVHVLWLPVGAVLLYLAAGIWHYVVAARERRALALEKERISTELALATRIQQNFLPKVFPDRQEFDLYASMTPAREVGGDLYDFFFIDEDHLCLVIGDVSGKGVPASLFMMLSSALIHHVAMHELSPAKILTFVNEEICSRNPEEMFVTVWLGVLQISTGLLTAASAGHEYPALKRPDGSFEILKDKHGFVLGGMEGVRYREYTLSLEPGTRLFLYTDGVPEAARSDNTMFGADRILAALNASSDASPRDLLSAVSVSVRSFVGPAEQFDDLTMLCFEYRGTSHTGTSHTGTVLV